MVSNNLNEYQSGNILTEFGIPVVKSIKCKDFQKVKKAVEKIGFPVVLKILSPDILHKTEAGCIITNIDSFKNLKKSYEQILKNAEKFNNQADIKGIIVQEMVSNGLELIIGVSYDQQFGHVLMFGHGGIYVEVYEDISFRLLPVNKRDIREMIQETKVYNIIKGVRGENYNINFLEEIIAKVAKLVKTNKDIKEVDINPFILFPDGSGGKAVDILITKKG